ncbi:hypothetical protein GCM10009741_02970 [Kribbella lupini]|uniref:Secreted protein n=1 Tax=Kribbella lupini TaxID=291602 RepID=A0ABP4KSH0_9ACTN
MTTRYGAVRLQVAVVSAFADGAAKAAAASISTAAVTAAVVFVRKVNPQVVGLLPWILDGIRCVGNPARVVPRAVGFDDVGCLVRWGARVSGVSGRT